MDKSDPSPASERHPLNYIWDNGSLSSTLADGLATALDLAAGWTGLARRSEQEGRAAASSETIPSENDPNIVDPPHKKRRNRRSRRRRKTAVEVHNDSPHPSLSPPVSQPPVQAPQVLSPPVSPSPPTVVPSSAEMETLLRLLREDTSGFEELSTFDVSANHDADGRAEAQQQASRGSWLGGAAAAAAAWLPSASASPSPNAANSSLHFRCFRRLKPGSSLFEFLVKGRLPLKADVLYALNVDTQHRPSWDKTVAAVEELGHATASDEHSTLLHWVTKFPPPLASRDYAMLRSSFQVDSSAVAVISKAVSDERVPRRRENVRVGNYWSCLIIRAVAAAAPAAPAEFRQPPVATTTTTRTTRNSTTSPGVSHAMHAPLLEPKRGRCSSDPHNPHLAAAAYCTETARCVHHLPRVLLVEGSSKPPKTRVVRPHWNLVDAQAINEPSGAIGHQTPTSKGVCEARMENDKMAKFPNLEDNACLPRSLEDENFCEITFLYFEDPEVAVSLVNSFAASALPRVLERTLAAGQTFSLARVETMLERVPRLDISSQLNGSCSRPPTLLLRGSTTALSW